MHYPLILTLYYYLFLLPLKHFPHISSCQSWKMNCLMFLASSRSSHVKMADDKKSSRKLFSCKHLCLVLSFPSAFSWHLKLLMWGLLPNLVLCGSSWCILIVTFPSPVLSGHVSNDSGQGFSRPQLTSLPGIVSHVSIYFCPYIPFLHALILLFSVLSFLSRTLALCPFISLGVVLFHILHLFLH